MLFRSRVDGEIKEILHGMKLDRYKNHNIEILVDKLVVSANDEQRLKQSIALAMKQGDGLIMVLDADTNELRHYSRSLMDPITGLSYSEPAPNNFSFNSPQGACPKCKGLGSVNVIDLEKVIPNPNESIYQGGIIPLGKHKNSVIFWQIEAILEKYGVDLKTPLSKVPGEAIDEIMNGTDERLKIKNLALGSSSMFENYDGLVNYIEIHAQSDSSHTAKTWAGQFSKCVKCPEWHGERRNQ